MTSRPDHNFILQPHWNSLRVLDADYKVGTFPTVDKPHLDNFVVGLVGGSHKLPFVPMGILVNQRNIEVIIMAMMARVDIYIEVGKPLVNYQKLSPGGITFRNHPIGLGAHAAVNVELREAGHGCQGESKYKKQSLHAAKIAKN